VSAVVNNAVHVEVEVVKLGNAVLSNELRYGRIALREPSEELGDTWISLSAERACKGRWRSTYPWRQLYFKTVADASNRDGERGDEEG
jgi:hypothetical protein